MTGLLGHLRLFEPLPGILAWYDGRVPGYRLDPAPNWVDEGALSVGIAAYAIWGDGEALVYDTHVTTAHAERMRADLAARGVTRFRVVLSHWHRDHVAGTAVFADSPVIASVRTAAHLARHRAALEDGSFGTPPAIRPLILPTATFDGEMRIAVAGREVRLLTFDIHSDDATVLWLPRERLLLAGDTLEDPLTYVAEPEGLRRHVAELARMSALCPDRILPAHGDPGRIAAGGFGAGLIAATARYVGWLAELPGQPARASTPLAALLAGDIAAGHVVACDLYDEVHAENVAAVLQAAG
ncbi:MAG: MBL fold metallo-hydrolase [Rhodobacteraceae bacterium]|nr:MBL fold metallo-hydrolase [Paracoccaceae bacterium]